MKVTIFTELKEARALTSSEARLIELAHHQQKIILPPLLRNPNTPAKALSIILENHSDERTWRDVAKHPNVTPEILTRLSTCEYPRILFMVAAHPETPTELLVAFALRDAELQQAVARNPAAPTDVLERLSRLEDAGVLYALAQNPNTPPAIAMRCGAKFPGALFKNPALDLMLLEVPEMISSLPSEQARALLYPQNPPEWVWKATAQHRDPWIRAQAAKHKNLPEWALEELRRDTDPKVQRAIRQRDNLKPL
jgi:hypothetical protein